MRTFSQGPVPRGVAHTLIAAFVWSLMLMGVGLTPAAAQIPTAGGPSVAARAATTQSVAVVPFENASGYRPETFGQETADDVATELRDRLNLDILPKADVELWLRNLGYKPPFSDAELQRLATELEVNMVVTGQIRAVRVVQGPEGRYGEVTMAVLLFDRAAQAPTNGALITSRGPASVDASDDALIAKALQQASFDAVQRMRTRPTVIAMVLWARDTTVFMNVGGRAGVEPGMKMVAVRNNLRIGMVEVTEADPVGSYASIVQGPPLRTGDHLRAIYQLPVGTAALTPQRIDRKRKGLHNFVLTAAAILGVTALATKSREMETGNVAAPGFMVSNLANGVALGFSDPDNPATVLSWVPFSGTEKTRLAGYQILRGDRTIMVLSADEIAAKNYFFDRSPGQGELAVTITIQTPADPFPTFNFSRASSTSELSETFADATYSNIFLADGPRAGVFFNYQVRPIVAVLVQTTGTAGTFQWRFSRSTDLSTPAGVTIVAPPRDITVAVASNVASFVFYTDPGADEAVIQFARDPDDAFPPSRTFSRVVPGVLPGKNLASVSLADITKGLPGAKSNIIWWRIGLRNRFDPIQARPFPFDRVSDVGWVWMGPPLRLPLASGTTVDVGMRRQPRDLSRLGVLGGNRDVRRPGAQRDRVLRVQ